MYALSMLGFGLTVFLVAGVPLLAERPHRQASAGDTQDRRAARRWTIEDRAQDIDAVAVLRWPSAGDVAVYATGERTRVFFRYAPEVTRLVYGTLPRKGIYVLLGGGAYRDRALHTFVVDEAQPGWVPSAGVECLAYLRRVDERSFEFENGGCAEIRTIVARTGALRALVSTRRRDLVPADTVVHARVPSADMVAASLSLDQLGELLRTIASHRLGESSVSEAPGSRFVKAGRPVERRAILQALAEKADDLLVEHVGRRFLETYYTRAPGTLEIPEAKILANPGHLPPVRLRPRAQFEYRLSAFGAPQGSGLLSVTVGLDGRILQVGTNLPDCPRGSKGCQFLVPREDADRIAREAGLEPGIHTWQVNLHWDRACRSFVWSFQNWLTRSSGRVMEVATGTGEICGGSEWSVN